MIKELCNCVFINNMPEKEAFKTIENLRSNKVLKCEDECTNSFGFN